MRKSSLAAGLFTLFMTACGGDDGGGGGPGGDPDASIPPGPCGIRVGAGQVDEATTFVVFSNPDGSLISAGALPVDGLASRDDCVAGTIISLVGEDIYGTPDIATEQVTFFGINPGVTIDFSPDRSSPVTPLMTTIGLDHATDPDGHSKYALGVGCDRVWGVSGAATSYDFTLADASCFDSGDAYSVLAASRNEDGVPIAFDSATGQTGTSVSLTTWTEPVEVSVSLADAPEGVLGASVGVGMWIEVVRNGTSFMKMQVEDPTLDDSGAAVGVLNLPPDGFAEKYAVTVRQGVHQQSQFQRVWSDPATSFSFEQAGFLEPASGVTIDKSVTPLTPTWELGSDSGEASFIVFGINYDTVSEQIGERDYHQARFFVPPGTTSFELPEVPNDFKIPSDVGLQITLHRVALDVDMTYGELLADPDLNVPANAHQLYAPVGVDLRAAGRPDLLVVDPPQ